MEVRLAAVAAFAYVVGGMPLGLWLVRMLRPGLDLRGLGSGNVGTSNIFRNVGTGIAVVVGPLQFAQGLVCVMVARWTGLDAPGQGLVAVAAVAGNGWPVLARFHGGRGIAVATGAVAGLGLWGLATLLVCFAAGALAGEVALGVLAGFVMLPAVEAAALGAAGLGSAVLLLLLVLARRLEGLRGDLRGAPAASVETVLGRLLHDRRPGRPLVGPRTDR